MPRFSKLYDVNEIDLFPGRPRRDIDLDTVSRLMVSIQKIGLQSPILVWEKPDAGEEEPGPFLIAGAHRLEAYKQLGFKTIPAMIYDGSDHLSDIDAELMEITENLHRAELTALERDTQVARWIVLVEAKGKEGGLISSQVATKKKGRGRKSGGVNAAARDLGIDRDDAHRATKVASLSDEAKAAAVDTGLDDNRSALLEAAKETTPKAQVAAIQRRAAKPKASKPVAMDDGGDEGQAEFECDALLKLWAGSSDLGHRKFMEKVGLVGLVANQAREAA